jgi:hypothetical protein
MSDSLRKVRAGQKFRFPAAAYNLMVDAAQDLLSHRQDQGSNPSNPGGMGVVIRIKNTTGEDLERYDILGIDDVAYGPDDNEQTFLHSPTFLGVVPTLADHVGRFAVVLTPLADGKIGRAAIAGVVPVYVNVLSADDWWADIDDGEHWTLRSGPSGSAQLLYKSAAGTGGMWCLARLGCGLPPGDTDYQTLVWDNMTKRYYPGPLRSMDIPPS